MRLGDIYFFNCFYLTEQDNHFIVVAAIAYDYEFHGNILNLDKDYFDGGFIL